MISTKERARLRGLANGIDTIFQIGKGGISDTLRASANDAITARELIKLRVLPTCELDARACADNLAQALQADVVQVIGTRFVLYRENPDKPMDNAKPAKPAKPVAKRRVGTAPPPDKRGLKRKSNFN